MNLQEKKKIIWLKNFFSGNIPGKNIIFFPKIFRSRKIPLFENLLKKPSNLKFNKKKSEKFEELKIF